MFAARGGHLRDVWEWVTSGEPVGVPCSSGFLEAMAPVFPLHQLVGHVQEAFSKGGGSGGCGRRSSGWKGPGLDALGLSKCQFTPFHSR